MSVRRLSVVAVVLVVLSVPVVANEITMKVPENCGFEWADLQVDIWNPPGGYAKVADDGTVTVDVPEGTKLSVLVAPSYCENECEDPKSRNEICKRSPDGCPRGMESCIEACTREASMKVMGKWTEAKDGGTLQVEACTGSDDLALKRERAV